MVSLLPLPVPLDERAKGRSVYFADIVVRGDCGLKRFEDLRGSVWAFNDRNSRSGWFAMLERCGESFFSRSIASGSHLRSMELVRLGEADAASIDSNVLRLQPRADLRVIESWGPFAIQPAIVRADLPAETRKRIAQSLLTLHDRHDLRRFGFTRFIEPDESLYA